MCLFSINRDQVCDHPECIDFYKLVRPNSGNELGKREPVRSDQQDTDKPGKKMSGKAVSKTALSNYSAKSPFKDEHGDTLFVPNEEASAGQNKPMPQDIDISRARFREPQIRPATQQLATQGPDSSLSSFGFFNLNRAANAPSQSFRGTAHYTNTSAFQVFGGNAMEEVGSGPLGVILSELRMQNKLSMEILEKVDMHNKMLSILIKDYQLSKLEKKQEEPQEPPVTNTVFFNLIGKGPEETLVKKDLFLFLKNAELEYKYQLEIDNNIEAPLVKERNFSLNLRLVDLSGQLVVNSNKVMMNIDLYTADNPPIKVKRNTLGNDILKGHKDNLLFEGRCTVPKLQIKEVTSHYRSGMVFLVVHPSKKNYNPLIADDKHFIDYRLIKPLIIDNIRVKAKMPKRGAADSVSQY